MHVNFTFETTEFVITQTAASAREVRMGKGSHVNILCPAGSGLGLEVCERSQTRFPMFDTCVGLTQARM